MTSKCVKTCPKCKGSGVIQKTTTKYKKGRNYEYIVASKLRQHGYTVRRAYASKGTFDLLCWKSGICYGIQVKNLSMKNKAYLTPKDRNSLNEHMNKGCCYEYEFHQWDTKIHGVRTHIINETIIPIHAYKDGMVTVYRKLISIDEWVPWKP